MRAKERHMKKKMILFAVVTIGLLAVISAVKFQQPSIVFDLFSQTKSTNSGKTVSYKGQAGKTALELLQKNAKTIISGAGKNAFVTSINGVKANPTNQYWQLKVNGKSASVGAGSFVTKNSDTITWELTSF